MNDFEKALTRPKDFFKLDASTQWDIDKNLGILDWDGCCAHSKTMCKACQKRFYAHFDVPKPKPKRKRK